jgi:hypothetical protein
MSSVTSDVLQLMSSVTSDVLQLMSSVTSDILQLMSCDSLCWYRIIIIIDLCYQSFTHICTSWIPLLRVCVTLDLCDRSPPYPSQALVVHHQQMYGWSTYCRFVRVANESVANEYKNHVLSSYVVELRRFTLTLCNMWESLYEYLVMYPK